MWAPSPPSHQSIIDRYGENNSEQAPKFAIAVLGHWNDQSLQRQAVDIPFGKGVDSLSGLEGSYAIMSTKHARLRVSYDHRGSGWLMWGFLPRAAFIAGQGQD